jgi:hypothetical protein
MKQKDYLFTYKAISYVCFMTILALFACRTNQTLSYSSIETTAIAAEMEGSYVIRVQGKGSTREMAYENARRQAVHDVIFKSVHTSYGDHRMIHPLINDPMVEQKEEAFFNSFFSDKGGYQNFVEQTKENKIKNSNENTNSVILNVVVHRDKLKEFLLSRGFIH